MQESQTMNNQPSCCHHGLPCQSNTSAKVNVGNPERILSVLGGALLIKRNLGRLSLSGLAKLFAGGALVQRGVSGHCNLYDVMSVSSASVKEVDYSGVSKKGIPVRAEMNVQVPPPQAYELWRDPANQSWIMGHFAKVETLSMDRAHWKLRGPMGLEWDALIVADSPGEFLSWETLPGASIPNEGTVRFVPTQTGGTRLSFEARFDPPAGSLGYVLMKTVGVTPQSVIGKALRRFKTMAEMEPSLTSQSPGPARHMQPATR